mgnify:CR=1 FL=1
MPFSAFHNMTAFLLQCPSSSVLMCGRRRSSLSCGVRSIDDLMRTAYNKTLYKQGLAYNIVLNGHLVGNCMLKIVCLCDETEEYYVTDKQYASCCIPPITIIPQKGSARHFVNRSNKLRKLKIA